MDELASKRLGARIIELFADDPDRSARPDIARALELMPQPRGERVWRDGDSVRFQVVTDERLFDGVLESGGARVVRLIARRLSDGAADAEMEQRNGGYWSRTWTFWPDRESVEVESRTEDYDDQRFARALAHRLGWAPPPSVEPAKESGVHFA